MVTDFEGESTKTGKLNFCVIAVISPPPIEEYDWKFAFVD